jgi:hypothetical protein
MWLRTNFTLLVLLITSLLWFPITVEAKASGEKVLILFSGSLFGSNAEKIASLLRGEGFIVDTVGKYFDESFFQSYIQPYDIIIAYHYSGDVSNVLASFVSKGKGLLIIGSQRKWDSILPGLAGVVVDADKYGDDTTSRIIDHPITKGVRSIKIEACMLKLVSSEAYPLVIGNDLTFGVKDPVLAVANTIGSGRVVALALKVYKTDYYEYDMFDRDLAKEDTALFIKNAVYWLAHKEVPSYTRDLPTLVSLENKITSLNASIISISKQIEEINRTIGGISKIKEIMGNIEQISLRLADIEKQVKDLSKAVTPVSQYPQYSQSYPMWPQYISVIGIFLSIIALAIALLGRKKMHTS